MTTSMLPDEDARRRIRSELDRNFIVEAGAGTGKTSLLVDRIEALVASDRVHLVSTVAITFTEKAAAELRVRIRERIESRLRGAEGVERERFRTALEELEIAPISTIHAFAADLLRERPVEAGVDPAFTVADELNASLFRTEAWDRWLGQQKGGERGPLREAIELGVSLTQLRALGDILLRHRDAVIGTWDRGSVPQDPVDWLAAAEPEIRARIARIETHCLDHDDNAVKDLRAIEQTLELFTRLDKSEVRRGILGGLELKIGGNQANWTKGVLADIKGRLAVLGAELQALQSAHAHYLAAGAVNWLLGYAEEYQMLKTREGVLDFDDLLLYARNVLRMNREVRAYFQRRFDAILVDEFQDTDPLQAEIIFFLAEDGARADDWDQVELQPGKLFIVGDPKQSIYAFRRADIETYEQAKEVLLRSGTLEYITSNFRSVAPILTAVNNVFHGKMRRPADGTYQPDYVALEHCPSTRPSEDSPAVALFYSRAQDDSEADVATLRHREAEALAAFLRHSIERGSWKVGEDRRPAQFGEVALLFRGMSDVPIYEEALKRYDVPYRVTSSRSFYKREEIGWLLNVLHAIEHPTDPVAVWGALRSPLFGCSDREVYEFVVTGRGSLDYRGPHPDGPKSIRDAYGVLLDLHQLRLELSVPQMVEKVLARTHGLETFLLLPQGEQRVANLAKVVTLARALEESGILTFRAFVHWLRDMEEHAVDEAESPTVEEGDDVVRIMSIHAAKGLEFPIVVVPDLGRGPGGGVDHLLVQRTKGKVAAYVGKVGDWLIQTNEYETLKARQTNRDAAERLRVLYVAMTRAKDALVLCVFPRPARGSIQEDLHDLLPQLPKFGENHRNWLVVNGEKSPRVTVDPPPIRLRAPAGATPEGEAVGRERHAWLQARELTVAMARKPDPVQNPSSLVDREALRTLEREGISVETEVGGRALGTLVHAVLASIPFDRVDLIKEYVQYIASRGGVSESVTDTAVALVQAALASESMRAARSAHSWSEVPFVKVGPGGITEGVIDLVVQTSTGMTIIDFKTDAVESSKQNLLRSLYSVQVQKYVDVLKGLGVEKVEGKLLFVRAP